MAPDPDGNEVGVPIAEPPKVPQFEADEYQGTCAVCGLDQTFVRSKRATRETYPCRSCRASLREREQARAILFCYPTVEATSMVEWARSRHVQDLRVYEPGMIGPFRKHLVALDGYQQFFFYEDPSTAEPGAPHQDLESLTFGDESFDLVISSDILEHVARPEAAFREIARVLVVGGFHVFTVPLHIPGRVKTVSRVELVDRREVHVLPERYHGNGRGGRSLVYTDFGVDVVTTLSRAGFSTYLMRGESGNELVDTAVTFVTQRVR